MSSYVILTVLAASSMWFCQGEAAQCAEICYTTELTGFGPGGAAGCSCSGSKATRAGDGGCSCGQCYDEANGAIIGYAVNSDGTCTYGTDCGDCTRSPDPTLSKPPTSPSSTTTNPTTSTPTPTTSPSSTSSTSTTTVTPITTSSVLFSDSSSNATTAPSSSSTDPSKSPTTPSTSSSSGLDNTNAGETAGSSAPKTGNEKGLKTWQIALIICCGVLLFTVAVVSVLSCYCKARNRLNENEDNLADATYYQQQHARQHSDVTGSSVPTPTLFPRNTYNHHRSGSSGSLNNEMKLMYENSANSGSSDRLGMGLASVHTRSSSGDLVGMVGTSYSNAGSYSNERILSGSYPIDRRQSSSNRSQGRQLNLEPRYSVTHDREPLAVEL
ncbi:unnamed protein product [Peronospora effusa]|nr:unnamed protein product [Peronospora effusa]